MNNFQNLENVISRKPAEIKAKSDQKTDYKKCGRIHEYF